MSRAPVVKF